MDYLRTLAEKPSDMQSEVEKFFSHLGKWKRPVFYFEKAWKPLCDVSEIGGEVIVVADIGGVPPENIDIKVEGMNLVLKGKRPEPAKATRRDYHLMEISYGLFERNIILPVEVDAEKASAVYDEGFLEIRLPKLEGGQKKGVDNDEPTG